MSKRFQLNHLILHYIGMRPVAPTEPGQPTKEKWRRQATALQDIAALDRTIVEHLLSLIEDTWDRPDAQAVHSARFDASPPEPERALLQGYLKELKGTVWSKPASNAQAQKDFLELSKKIDDRLYESTTLAASPGLLMVADFSATEGDGRYLALLKIRHEDARYVAILQDSLTDLTIQDVDMQLTKDVLKGVIWPHPSRRNYDLKLVDKQAKDPDRPARYFTEVFLGCEAKDPDAAQAARVPARLPEAIAKKLGLAPAPERMDAFIAAVVQKTEPTAASVAQVAMKTGLIKEVAPDELQGVLQEDLADQLPDINEGSQLEADLKEIADAHGWPYDPGRRRAFRLEMDDAMHLDEQQAADALVSSGMIEGVTVQEVSGTLKEMGGLDVPRRALVMRTKTKPRTLNYYFEVPRRVASPAFVQITISGPPETMRRFLSRQNGGNYVFTIETAPQGFEMDYK